MNKPESPAQISDERKPKWIPSKHSWVPNVLSDSGGDVCRNCGIVSESFYESLECKPSPTFMGIPGYPADARSRLEPVDPIPSPVETPKVCKNCSHPIIPIYPNKPDDGYVHVRKSGPNTHRCADDCFYAEPVEAVSTTPKIREMTDEEQSKQPWPSHWPKHSTPLPQQEPASEVEVWIDPRTKEPCRRCDGTGNMPPWPDSKGLVVCGVCRAEMRPVSTELPPHLKHLKEVCLHAVTKFELTQALTSLAAMTADRNLWQDAHNEDCPNFASLAAAQHDMKVAEESEDHIKDLFNAAVKRAELAESQLAAAQVEIEELKKERR